MEELPQLFRALGLSLLIGLLVGLQREAGEQHFAGLRSFALVALYGTVCGFLAMRFGGWVLAAGFLGIVAVMAAGNLPKLRQPFEDIDPGTTTEVALLLTFALGAYLAYGRWEVAVVVGGATAVLLHFKPELHGAVQSLSPKDLRAIMQFVLITFIVLPVLPDRGFGPLQSFNPFEIWLMVTLIVGISVAGYLVYQFLGRRAGVLLGGVLGGAVSSTATTMAFARRARGGGAVAAPALIIAVASAVAFVRVLAEVSVVAPALLLGAALPLGAVLAALLAPSLLYWRWVKEESTQLPPPRNPTELGVALGMAVLYALITVALNVADRYVGENALFLVAIVSGLTDVDAVTLSVAQMGSREAVAPDVAWRLILVANLSNLVFKVAMAGVLGGVALLRVVLALTAPGLALGVGLAWWG